LIKWGLKFNIDWAQHLHQASESKLASEQAGRGGSKSAQQEAVREIKCNS